MNHHKSMINLVALFGAGTAVGALITMTFLSKRRHQRRRNIDDVLALEDAKREALPSTIILVRHGESEGNADHTLYRTKPDNLVELTARGEAQAVAAGKRIKTILGIEDDDDGQTAPLHMHFMVSPFERCLQTAQNIRRSFDTRILETYVEPRIREQEFGNLQGDDFKTFRSLQRAVGRFWYRFPTGESGADVHDRVKSWWSGTVLTVNLRSGYRPVDALVVVTHGLTMRFVLMQLYGWSPTTFHTVWNAGNCDMYVLKKDLSMPGPSPYVLDEKKGDVPQSSIEMLVEVRGGETKRLVLQDYLSIPQPRTIQHRVVKRQISEQNPDIDANDIVAINFRPSMKSARIFVEAGANVP